MHPERITSVRKIGIRPTLDIEVNHPDHIFYADGIVSQNSHSMEYSETSIWCMFAKQHFPLHFFCSWLSMAEEKSKTLEEVRELVQDAKQFGIDVYGPSLFEKRENFHIDNKNIRFGIGNVKGVGISKTVETLEKIAKIEQQVSKNIRDMSWYEILIFVLPKLGKTVTSNLIAVGALSKFGISRTRMLFEYNKVVALTDREVTWIQQGKFLSLLDGMIGLVNSSIPNKNRKVTIDGIIKSMESDSSKLVDSVGWISTNEDAMLGISVTCSKLDVCDTSSVNCTSKEFKDTQLKHIIVAVQLDKVSEWFPKDKPENLMCFLTGRDAEGSIEMVVSPKEYKDNAFLLFKGNTVLITGTKSAKGNLSVRKVSQI